LWGGLFKKKSPRNALGDSRGGKNFGKKRKKILAVWKMVVSLHPLSTGKRTRKGAADREAKGH